MLGIGQGRSTTGRPSASGLGWDFRQPLDFQQISTTVSGYSHATPEATDPVLPCPLLCSGLSASGQRYVTNILTPHGFLPVAAGTGLGGGTKGASAGFVPGSVLMVPLVDGDVRLAVLGTVTEVREDRVFGFGHSFLGQGEIELPLATGQIHTVVSNLSRSFKLGSVLQTVGALIQDEPVGVVGILGRQAPTIPVTLHIDHYLRSQGIDYTCRVARHLSLTPELLKALIEGTVMGLGALPPDHTVTYEAAITLQTGRVLRWTNVSTGSGLRELLMEMLGSVALLLNNPFQVVEIGAIDLAVAITPVNTMSYIAALEVPDRRLKPGDTVRVQVTLETFRADKQRHDLTVTLPQDIAPGKYTLSIGGSYDYQRTLRQRAPHKLMAHDVSSLLDALDFALHQERDRLYCVLELPGKGLALERQEMPYLPESRALILRSAKRTAPWTPILPWMETNRRLDTVIMDGEKLTIEVE
jgi:hypothetical protein